MLHCSMPLDGLPEDVAVTGTIQIAITLGAGGTGLSYGFDGITTEAAIGYLTVILDRLRQERSLQWDHCPGCGQPWAEHDFDDDEEDDD